MASTTVRSLHLRIERTNDRSILSIFNDGLNVSENVYRLIASDFLALANMAMSLGDLTITRRYSGGPIVKVEFELMELANVARVPL